MQVSEPSLQPRGFSAFSAFTKLNLNTFQKLPWAVLPVTPQDPAQASAKSQQQQRDCAGVSEAGI